MIRWFVWIGSLLSPELREYLYVRDGELWCTFRSRHVATLNGGILYHSRWGAIGYWYSKQLLYLLACP